MLRIERLHGAGRARRPRALTTLTVLLSVVVLLAGCSGPVSSSASSPVGKAVTSSASPTAQPFDPSVGAPLPNYRIVAAYGIANGVDFNGHASNPVMLSQYLPQM